MGKRVLGHLPWNPLFSLLRGLDALGIFSIIFTRQTTFALLHTKSLLKKGSTLNSLKGKNWLQREATS